MSPRLWPAAGNATKQAVALIGAFGIVTATPELGLGQVATTSATVTTQREAALSDDSASPTTSPTAALPVSRHGAATPRSRAAASTTSRPGASRPATTRAVVARAAESLLAMLTSHYARSGPLHLTGRIHGEFDVAGRHRTYDLKVDGLADGAGRFRHDAGSAGLIVSDTHTTFLYDTRRDAFAELAATPGRVPAEEISPSIVAILLDENPALLFAIVDDAGALLTRVATRIDVPGDEPSTRAAVTRPSTASRPAAELVLTLEGKTITLRLDAAGRVTSSAIDYRPLMTARGATLVKAADVALAYETRGDDVVPADAFAWRPPASATEFDAGEDLLRPATRPAVRPTTNATTAPGGGPASRPPAAGPEIAPVE